MEVFIVLLWCLWGAICYKMAEKNGRNPILAGVLGIVFGLFAVLGYWVAGEKTE